MALRELLAVFNVQVNGLGDLKKVDAAFDTAKEKTTSLVPALEMLKSAWGALAAGGIALAVRGLVTWTAEVTKAADPIKDFADITGISTYALQEWSALAKDNGAEATDMQAAIRKLAMTMQAAGEGGESQAAAFKKIGLSAKELEGMTLDEQFAAVTVGLANVSDEGKRLALTQELLGKSANKLIPMFAKTSEELDANLEAAGRLHGVMSAEFIETATEFNDVLDQSRNQWQVFRSEIVMAVLPAVKWLVETIRDGLAALTAFARETRLADRAMKMGGFAAIALVLKTVFGNLRMAWSWASRFVGVILRFARIIAPWLLWALVLDDIIVFLQGGDSALGHFLDKLFGAGTAAKVLEFIESGAQRVWEELKLAIKWLGDLWAEFEESGAAADALRFMSDMVWLVIQAVKLLLETIAAVGILVRMTFGKVTSDELDKLQAQFFRVTRGIDRFFDAVFGGIADGFTATINFLIGGVEKLINFLAIPLTWLRELTGETGITDFKLPRLGEDGEGPSIPRGGFGGGNREVRGGDINVEAIFTGPVTKQSAEFTKAELGEMTFELAGQSNKDLANNLWADE